MVDIDVANLQPNNLNCAKLNEYITQGKIKKSIKNLKNKKVSGEDGIRNEYIKAIQFIY